MKITDKLQNLWSSDEIRILVLASLGIQIALIFLAPLRKRNTNIMLAFTLWLLYLIADNVATLGLGNISHQTPGVSSELTVLWAPFLLVHLGGPDTITSYSIEDNELWWRHLLGLVFQVIITVYVFFQSPPTGWLWIPTIFVFIPGLIKFAERTHALRLASKDYIKDKIISELRPGNRTMKDRKDNTTSNPVTPHGTIEGSEDNTPSNPVPPHETTEGRWSNLKNKIMSALCPAKDTIGSEDNTTSNPVPANQTTEGSEDNNTSNPVPANQTTEGSEDNTTSISVPANRTTEGRWGNLKNKIMSALCPAKDTIGSEDNTTSNPVSANQTTEGTQDNTTSNPVPANQTTEGRWGIIMGKIKSALFPPEDTIDDLGPTFDDISNESKAILEGFRWYNIFKRLLVDVTFPADLLMKSQDRFSDISSTDALKMVAIELSFLYDVLHTKAVHMHCFLGRALRYFSLVSIIAAFVVFHLLDKQKYVSGDIIITYILFGVGLSLEVIATMLLILSDWTVMALARTESSKCVASCIPSFVKAFTFRKGIPRWARTIGQYNLVGVCLRDRDTILAKVMRVLKIKHLWDNMWESRLIPLCQGLLEEIMVTEAKRRAQNVHIYNVLVEARSYRGNKALERHNQLKNLGWSMKREFDECIILWHLATDICYYENFNANQSNKNGSDGTTGKDDTEREVSWKTSNYMVYLLTQQQSMMQLGYGKTRFEATCAVVKNKIKKEMMGKKKLTHKEAHGEIKKMMGKKKLTHKEEHDEIKKDEATLPGDGDVRKQTNNMGTLVLKNIWACLRSCWGWCKSEEDKREEEKMGSLALTDGLKLVENLQNIDEQIRWKLISETWMEMLGYAAIHCNSYQHAKSLSRGGELLTHLWLLMAQLGVVDEHKVQQFESGSV